MATRADRRESVVRAAIDVIAEKGLGGTRIADIAERAGMSPGHVLYYFDGKSAIFTRALRMIEDDLRAEARAAFERLPAAADRWAWLIEQAAPTGPDDVRVLLWIEAWARAPREPDVSAVVIELDRRWVGLLVELVEYGRATGEFRIADAQEFAVRFAALVDGLTLQVVAGSQSLDRERMVDICMRQSVAELRG
ncbi:MAG TPA: TetR family transcriptional regulator C-terminal domain-containing protein [Solirubrobacteraceae bacterium]|nr:TetR family transcriptional regulator C-terminal domain-containing protein [Solirubrobacteraceae bacterium]